MIRLAHFSDLHYGHKTLAEADRCFGAAIDQAIEARVQAAVLSGDVTDHALDLHAPAALRLMERVKRLAEHCPVLMLQGTFSHEPPGALSVFRLLGARYPIHVADRIEQVLLSCQGQWLPSDTWRFDKLPLAPLALFSCVPTVNKAVATATVGATHAATSVAEHLAALLAGFAPIHREARVRRVPTIGVSHGTVFGCTSEHGVPMAGFDHEFTTATLFAAEATAFMLGHIHQHQGWTADHAEGMRCIAYAGSIGRFHYGEQGDKGFLIWEVGADAASFELHATPARKTMDIVFEGRPNLEALREAVAQQSLAGASVRVRWTVAEEDKQAIDRAAIQALLGEAAEVKLEGRIVPVLRTRAAGIAQLTSLVDKVRLWAHTTQCTPGPLLDCLGRLISASPEEIAEVVLQDSKGSSALVCEPASGEHDGLLPEHACA